MDERNVFQLNLGNNMNISASILNVREIIILERD